MTLASLVLIGGLNQSLHTGGRVAVALTAVGLGASPFVIGTITALYGLVPMLVSLHVGKLNDRIGPRLPMFAGTLMFVIGGLVPTWHPSLASLYVAATLIGLGNMTFQLSIQNAVGFIGAREDRTRNFSSMAIGMSGGAIVGPLVAGYAIDYAGYEPAFMMLAALPLVSLVMLSTLKLDLVVPASRTHVRGATRTRDLLANRGLRAIYLITALHVMSWELFTFLMPVHGSAIGLSASTIGIVMGAFSAATFFMRVFLPPLARRFDHWQLIKAALVLAGAMFVALPLMSHTAGLVVLAFILGAGLGAAQPLTMTLMHESAPPGRIGESLGIRTTVICALQCVMPLLFGGVGTALGMGPVAWAVAFTLWGGVAATRTGARGKRDA
jgi:MFS family permease